MKAAVMPALKFAKYTIDDLCRNSCDVPGHLKECARDKAMIRAAFRAMR